MLELIESILVNNGDIFIRYPEHTQLLEKKLAPLIIRYFSEKQPFSITVRVSRILLLIIKGYVSFLNSQCELALGLLVRFLEPDSSMPWKRVICMEVFRSLYSDFRLILAIYDLYDQQEGRNNIIRDHMAYLVRLSSEKPSAIGLSQQSTLPSAPVAARDSLGEQVALEAAGVAGVIGSSSSSTLSACGVSAQWSLPRSPYLEVLDKAEPPVLPETYIYSLTLSCIGVFSESLAKFVLPLTVPDSKTRRKNRDVSEKENTGMPQLKVTIRPSKKYIESVNPLEIESHPQKSGIKTVAAIIEECWPAVLATCSTFLYAALDNEFYHNLVRSFQKFAHVAGLLRLVTPRDAFLTTLGKAAIPVDNTTSSNVGSSSSQEQSIARSTSTTELSPYAAEPSFTTRNLLCLRALLNLGIALGSTLSQSAWFIILDTLQHANLVIGPSAKTVPKPSSDTASVTETSKTAFGAEVFAVQSASTKMLESTADYPDSSFKNIFTALLSLSDTTANCVASHDMAPSMPTGSEFGSRQSHRKVSVAIGKLRIYENELSFVLEKTHDLAMVNAERLSLPTDVESIWPILVDSLVTIAGNEAISSSLRVRASTILDNLVFMSMKIGSLGGEESCSKVQIRGFEALEQQISALYRSQQRPKSSAARSADVEVHCLAVDTLRGILEECGESLIAGWNMVFRLISSVFGNPKDNEKVENTKQSKQGLTVKSPKLVRISFNSLQLVTSDFLNMLPSTCLLDLVVVVSNFAVQIEDFNISLTSTASFWNISDFLKSQMVSFSIEDYIDISLSDETLTERAKDQDIQTSRNSLWMLLLLRIVDLSNDYRSEIRNTAIQTALRILDSYGLQLSSRAWFLCLNKILLVMAEGVHSEVVRAVFSLDSNDDDTKSWIETSILVTKGLSDLVANYFDVIKQDAEFTVSWNRLLRNYEETIKTGILALDEAVFSSFSSILSQVISCEDVGVGLLRLAWSVWAEGNPAKRRETLDLNSPNQDTLLAYLQSYEQLYRLLKHEIDEEHVSQILQNLRVAIWDSIISPYSLDIDHSSELQKLTISCLKVLCEDRPWSQTAIVPCLADFSRSALMKWSPERDRRRPSFIAFSRSATQLLAWYVSEHGITADIFSNGALRNALEQLALQINSKYLFPGNDRNPPLWRLATLTSLDILQVTVPYVEKMNQPDQKQLAQFWRAVVDISRGIVSAAYQEKPNLPKTSIFVDEEFDISAFSRLKQLIVPSLGTSSIPDALRREFACALFRASFIYPLHPLDLSDDTVERLPLLNLYHVRMGRTHSPSPTLRSRMAYSILDTLFDLVSATPSTPKPSTNTASTNNVDNYNRSLSVTLAKSVSPYFILRCALTLKAYIADHPLRGRMPQPAPARAELLYLLRRLVVLDSEPAAIPARRLGESVRCAGENIDEDDYSHGHDYSKKEQKAVCKNHLRWLYPLVVRAVSVAGRETDDGIVLDELNRLLGAMIVDHGTLDDEDEHSVTDENSTSSDPGSEES